MITDQVLDTVIDQCSSQVVDLAAYYESLSTEMPMTVAALLDADTRLLSEEEHDYMLYLAMILLRAIREVRVVTDHPPETIGEAEEKQWQVINDRGNNALQKIWDEVDEDAVLQDFILDALGPDEMPEFLTETGAQIIYAKLMAIVDCLDGQD